MRKLDLEAIVGSLADAGPADGRSSLQTLARHLNCSKCNQEVSQQGTEQVCSGIYLESCLTSDDCRFIVLVEALDCISVLCMSVTLYFDCIALQKSGGPTSTGAYCQRKQPPPSSASAECR